MNNSDTRPQITPEKLEKACRILKVIAHPVRMSVIELLDKYEQLNVGEIQEHIEIEQAALSHHLINMKDKGVLQCFRDGKNMVYSLKEKKIVKILDCLSQCEME
ncbi:metalloregulator ArsR/SmtB family transcription factor [Cytophagaceae bacterium ABcell3]|nr:metalloregulator ArsR/SmtB family transcription factor [Cytophagaceae bacterium ABcell3]